MNLTNVFNRTEETVKLAKAILIYTSNSQAAVAMLHPVSYGKKNTPQLGAGAGLSLGDLQSVIYSLIEGHEAARSDRPTLISENVIALSMTMIAWWKPAHVSPMWTTCVGPQQRARDYTHPNLFFIGTPQTLSVWALKERKRPTESTPLFHAPYFNVYATGNMCRGNASYPPFITPRAIEVFEKAFFETNFTHQSHEHLIKRAGGVKQFWRDMKGKKLKRVPSGCFVPAKLTVGKAIQMATTNRHE
jgi:PRTRC genetic system protein B